MVSVHPSHFTHSDEANRWLFMIWGVRRNVATNHDGRRDRTGSMDDALYSGNKRPGGGLVGYSATRCRRESRGSRSLRWRFSEVKRTKNSFTPGTRGTNSDPLPVRRRLRDSTATAFLTMPLRTRPSWLPSTSGEDSGQSCWYRRDVNPRILPISNALSHGELSTYHRSSIESTDVSVQYEHADEIT